MSTSDNPYAAPQALLGTPPEAIAPNEVPSAVYERFAQMRWWALLTTVGGVVMVVMEVVRTALGWASGDRDALTDTVGAVSNGVFTYGMLGAYRSIRRVTEQRTAAALSGSFAAHRRFSLVAAVDEILPKVAGAIAGSPAATAFLFVTPLPFATLIETARQFAFALRIFLLMSAAGIAVLFHSAHFATAPLIDTVTTGLLTALTVVNAIFVWRQLRAVDRFVANGESHELLTVAARTRDVWRVNGIMTCMVFALLLFAGAIGMVATVVQGGAP